MWWNFIGRSHEEIVEQREAWNEGGFEGRPQRFGTVEDFPEPRLLAPADAHHAAQAPPPLHLLTLFPAELGFTFN